MFCEHCWRHINSRDNQDIVRNQTSVFCCQGCLEFHKRELWTDNSKYRYVFKLFRNAKYRCSHCEKMYNYGKMERDRISLRKEKSFINNSLAYLYSK